MSRILLIGAFGDGSPTSSGQIIRTRITYDELRKRYGARRVRAVNTTNSGRNRLRFLLHLIAGIIGARTIMVIVSENGMRVLYPILEKAVIVFRKNVLNSLVGGTVEPILRGYPQCRSAMRCFTINWVQLPSMIDELKAEGVFNVEVLPNSKPLTPTKIEELEMGGPPFRFCTFSRVSKEKGIEAAIQATIKMNEKGIPAELDVFGKPDEGYEETFQAIMNKVPKYIHYCGVAPYDKTAELLKKYYMLLFPTTFDGEGFPGTLVDALFAGLPTIATEWKHNGEVIRDGVTGYLYDYQEPDMLLKLMEQSVQHPEIVYNMRRNCIQESEKYSIDKVMEIITKRIG